MTGIPCACAPLPSPLVRKMVCGRFSPRDCLSCKAWAQVAGDGKLSEDESEQKLRLRAVRHRGSGYRPRRYDADGAQCYGRCRSQRFGDGNRLGPMARDDLHLLYGCGGASRFIFAAEAVGSLPYLVLVRSLSHRVVVRLPRGRLLDAHHRPRARGARHRRAHAIAANDRHDALSREPSRDGDGNRGHRPRVCAQYRTGCRRCAVRGVQLACDVSHLGVRVGSTDRLRACRRSGARGERRRRPSRRRLACLFYLRLRWAAARFYGCRQYESCRAARMGAGACGNRLRRIVRNATARHFRTAARLAGFRISRVSCEHYRAMPALWLFHGDDAHHPACRCRGGRA